MNITLDQLTDLVAIAIGDFTSRNPPVLLQISEGTDLRDMVKPLAEIAARKAVLDLPLEKCSHLYDLSPIIINHTDWGEDDFFTCSLPDDFLRLHTLWMPDWPCPLSEDEPGDPQRLSLGERAPKWMLTRRLRPMLRLMPATEAASAQLRFGPTSARRPLMSAYVPAPHFDDAGNTLCALQPDALLPTVDMISKRIGDSLGYN